MATHGVPIVMTKARKSVKKPTHEEIAAQIAEWEAKGNEIKKIPGGRDLPTRKVYALNPR